MIRLFKRNRKQNTHYSLYKYRTEDGEFDYEKYRLTQENGNIRKIDKVWVEKGNIDFLCNFIGRATFGICHGTRRGLEQEWFSDRLNCHVIGTEISSTATQFKNTIQWDFHDDNPEWHNSADFVYSNSFDHAYDPSKALCNWMKCLKPSGVCIIEHTSGHEGSNELDPFGASIEWMPYLILTWSGGRFCATQIIDAPEAPKKTRYCKFIIIRNIDTMMS